MDPFPHRVLWPDLTGREQHEWYQAFMRLKRTAARHESTLGLRGTDLSRFTNAAEVRAAVARSPTLAVRRPDNHAVTEDEWPQPQRLLF